MKIGNCGASGHIDPEGLKSEGKRIECTVDFKALLEEEVSEVGGAVGSSSSQIESTGGISAVAFLSSVDSRVAAGTGDTAIPEIERSDRVLDEVRLRLESGQASLMDVEESMKALHEESDRLASVVGSVSSGHRLAQMVQDLSVLSYVESIKWRRGDYV